MHFTRNTSSPELIECSSCGSTIVSNWARSEGWKASGGGWLCSKPVCNGLAGAPSVTKASVIDIIHPSISHHMDDENEVIVPGLDEVIWIFSVEEANILRINCRITQNTFETVERVFMSGAKNAKLTPPPEVIEEPVEELPDETADDQVETETVDEVVEESVKEETPEMIERGTKAAALYANRLDRRRR